MRAHPAGAMHGDVTVAPPSLGPPPTRLDELDPAVWPIGTTRQEGAIVAGGCDVRELAATHGTPSYLLVEDDVRARCRAYREAFGNDADIFYAAKAFISKEFARWVVDEDLSLDVSTGGELAVALAAGIDPTRILVHGNNKSMDEIADALEARVGRIVLDSDVEIERLAAVATKAGVRQRVMIRVTVGVEAHTHEFIATAHEDQKFGFSLASGAALDAVRQVLATPSLELVGLHSHIGSQIFDTAGFDVAAHRVVGLLAAVRDAFGIELPELDLGGGLGIAYVTGDDPADIADVAKQLRVIVERECAAASLAVPRLAVEPGRAIVGPAGVTIYEVGTVKDADGIRTYVSVDGGMSDNIRTALYDATYTCVLASRVSEAPPMLSRVVGKHCESGDIVVRDTWLPSDIRPGDLLAIAATGAYCRSMASNYNALLRPPVIAVGGGHSRVLLRRETLDDLLAVDLG